MRTTPPVIVSKQNEIVRIAADDVAINDNNSSHSARKRHMKSSL